VHAGADLHHHRQQPAPVAGPLRAARLDAVHRRLGWAVRRRGDRDGAVDRVLHHPVREDDLRHHDGRGEVLTAHCPAATQHERGIRLHAQWLVAFDDFRNQLVQNTRDLVRIPSTNTPPTGAEKACQDHIAALLRDAGVEVDYYFLTEVEGLEAHPSY